MQISKPAKMFYSLESKFTKKYYDILIIDDDDKR